MNNLTSLETILIIYIIAVNILGVITLIMSRYARRNLGEIIFVIMFLIAIPITLPIVLYLLTFEKLKRRKRKQLDDLTEEL